MQLVAIGQQDAYLTENPTITFWKRAYQRHTNFAVESIEQTFVGQVQFGGTASVNISRNGDLLNKAYIHVELPKLDKGQYIRNVGHALIKSVTMSIGGQKIDRHTGEWMHLWNRLAGKNLDGLSQMIGGAVTGGAQTLYIPLHFWWNRTPGMALPLIALQYHEVKIEVNFNTLNKLVVGGTGVTANGSLAAKLYVDYVYIDNEERKRFAQANHEYLIDQVQETSESFNGTHSKKVGLNFNHPVKELVWVVNKTSDKPENTFSFGKTAGESANWWTSDLIKFSETEITAIDSIPNTMYDVGTVDNYDFEIDTGTITYYKTKGDFYSYFRINPSKDKVWSLADGLKNSSNNMVYDVNEVEIYKGPSMNGNSGGDNNTIKKAKISLNGHDRFSERDAQYFNLVQPYQHHSNMPGDGVYCYSFALEPESEQPSGSCNFSRIDRAELVLEPNGNMTNAEVRVYAVNFNVLRLMGGMGGVAYAN
jgi:hypothetical protein